MTYDRFFNLSKTQETPHSSSMGYGMSFVSSKSDLWSANATAVLWVMIYWTALLQHRKPGIIADKDLSRYCIYPYTQSIPLLMTWRHNKHGLDIFSWDLPVSGLLYSCMKSSDVTKIWNACPTCYGIPLFDLSKHIVDNFRDACN